MKGHENKKKILQSQIMARGKNGEREKKCMPCVVSKDLYSRILGGSEKGSEGQTQLQYI
jgi:hypothetical protein